MSEDNQKKEAGIQGYMKILREDLKARGVFWPNDQLRKSAEELYNSNGPLRAGDLVQYKENKVKIREVVK